MPDFARQVWRGAAASGERRAAKQRDGGTEAPIFHRTPHRAVIHRVAGAEPPAVPIDPHPEPMAGDIGQLTAIAEKHCGLITITAILSCGFTRSWAAARVDSTLWQRVHRGVYATFPHDLTWEQKARAGLLLAGKLGALSHRSAGYLHGLLTDAPKVIEITLPHSVKVAPAEGLLFHRTRRAFAMVRNPYRTTLLDTVVDLVDTAANPTEVLSRLTGGIRSGLHPKAILTAAAQRRLLGNRGILCAILAENVDGVESTLEYQFHTNVVRAHGLPAPTRQSRQRVRDYWIRSDCWFEDYGLRVELDGEVAHPGKATDTDVLRDNDVLLTLDEITLRFRWIHTLGGACLSAAQLTTGLRRGGFQGEPQPCSPACHAPAEFRKLVTRAPTGRI